LTPTFLFSGSLWQGPSARLISAAFQGKAQIFLSLTILLEFRETLDQPRFSQRLTACGVTADTLTNRFRAACHEVLVPEIVPPPELRDRDDLHVLATAVGAQADAIVTGDKDLLTMKSFGGIPIIDPVEALRRLDLP
jgi:putative PIN family toxin of toxin-antitoxin system